MKKNRLLLIVLPIAFVLIAAIVISAVALVGGQKKEEQYAMQMSAAREYMAQMDYERVVDAYQAAIELRPEEPKAYVALAETYIAMGSFEDASYIAELGFLRTEDSELDALRLKIPSMQADANAGIIGPENPDALDDVLSPDAADDEDASISLRYATIEQVADYCYAEYIGEYGDATVTVAPGDEGYAAKFRGLNAYAYFRNTEEYRDQVDPSTRTPARIAKPYKVLLSVPNMIFVGYHDYISSGRLRQMFNTEAQPVLDEASQKYFVEFEYMDCRFRIETDSAGNVSGSSPVIELYPQTLVKEDYVEETEESETEEPGTFQLGSHTYAYDVTSIVIYGENIPDLSPLADCKSLRELVLSECTIGSLDPLAGCSSLEILDLRYTTGFSDLTPLAGLGSLQYLDLHGSSDVSDILPIMGMNLALLHTCETGVTYEQTQSYKDAHPDCEVWYDNHII